MSRHIFQNPNMKAPVITIFKNGDRHFAGKKVVINKHIRSFDNFLDKLTRETNAKTAIRRIYTPTHGTNVSNLDAIENGRVYVAAGVEKFRYINYGDKVLRPIRKSQIRVKPQLRKAISSRYIKEAHNAPLRNRIIFVSRNGEGERKPLKVILDKRMLMNMEMILQHLSDKLQLTTGSVGSLYSLDGKKIKDTNDLNAVTHYVAVGCNRNFIRTTYEPYEHIPTRKNIFNKKYMGTFVGLTKTRKNNKNPFEFDGPQAYNKLLAAEGDEPPLDSTEEVEKVDDNFPDVLEDGTEENVTMECPVCGTVDCETEDHKEKYDAENPKEDDGKESDPTFEQYMEDKEDETEAENVDSNNDTEFKEDLDNKNVSDDKESVHESVVEDSSEIVDVPEEVKDTETEIQNAERTSWSPGHKPGRKPYVAGDLDTTVEERLSGMRGGRSAVGSRGTGAGYRATGEQGEVGEEVREDGKTRVEKTIDMLPAATVQEELEE